MKISHQIVKFNPPRELTHTERAVLERLLSCEFTGVQALRMQLASVRIEEECRDCSTIGFFINLEVSIRAKVRRRIPVEAEGIDADGERIYILLHVVDGFMNELEIYREDLSNIRVLPPPETLELINYD